MIKKIIGIALLGIILGCTLFFSAEVPMKMISYSKQPQQTAENLMIFLPGRFSSAIDFHNEGFTQYIKDSGLNIDFIYVEAHLGYYVHRNLALRLYEDVIKPIKSKNYKNIWLVGISIGGFGALMYAKDYSESLKGVLVIAPYLGDDEVFEEIDLAGGLSKWNLKEIPSPDQDYQRNLWYWLKNYVQSNQKKLDLYIGFGTQDRFVVSNEILAKELPGSHVIRANGNHDWQPWREIFKEFLVRIKTQYSMQSTKT